MSEWKVKVNQDVIYQVSEEKNELFLEGKPLDIDLLELEKGMFHLIHQGRSYSASLVKLDTLEKRLTIKINNRKYDLEVEDQYDQLLQKLGMDNLASAAISQPKAPMPGLVLNVMVEAGQTVSKDDSLLILEAMKMENVLRAKQDGVVQTIPTKVGASLTVDQVILEFE